MSPRKKVSDNPTLSETEKSDTCHKYLINYAKIWIFLEQSN